MDLKIKEFESHGFEFLRVEVDWNTFISQPVRQQISKHFQNKFPYSSIIFESRDSDGIRQYQGDENICNALRSKPEITLDPWRKYSLDFE